MGLSAIGITWTHVTGRTSTFIAFLTDDGFRCAISPFLPIMTRVVCLIWFIGLA
jgi:hypothetical protein